ncbi:MAG: DJ-1/PfpI family protein [Candidatus Omnitrophica bacterium]|nr:DJ-1/PfpI family protein [Candidatus Omnitrophota bacterium]
MTKKALVILAEGFEEIEAVTSIDILRRSGVEVTIAGLNNLMIKGANGINIIADKIMEEITPNFDACILPGGLSGAKNLASSEKAKSLILDMNNQGKIIGAICASPAIVLAPWRILDNKKATCYTGMNKNFGSTTTFVEENVVVDGNIITSRGPATSLLFAFKIVEELTDKESSDKLKKSILLL